MWRRSHSLYIGIWGWAAGMGYAFTSSGIYWGHTFKVLNIVTVLGYNLPAVCIFYGHKMRRMVFLGSEFKPACNGINTAWFPGCIKINTR